MTHSSLPWERSGAHTTDLESFANSFHGEKVRLELLGNLAADMQNQLAWYFRAPMKLRPKELDLQTFEVVYDPSLPTIAVDPDSTYSGSELLGLASHEDATRVNIVYISPVTDAAMIKRASESEETRLQLQSGAMVTPEGQVVYGEFPQPIPADIIETADLALIEQCEAYNIPTFHSSEKMRQFNDKAQLDLLSNNAHTYNPRRLARAAFLESIKTDNLVIKPSKHSQGRGVLLTDNDADVQHTKNFYRFLEDNNYEPVVEERARSWEITDPHTGERLDWNVRAILSYGDLIGMYVRADSWGGPVNMSVSARAISMEDFPDYFTSREDAWRVVQKLHDAAQAVAEETPSSLVGIDLTVDENMEACLFEINNGHTGGLQTIAGLENTYDTKMDMTRQILRKLIDNIHKLPESRDDETEMIALRPSFSAFSVAAYRSSLKERLNSLDVAQIPDTDHERFGAVLALVAISASAFYGMDVSKQRQANERLKTSYPLEMRRYITSIYAGSYNKREPLSYLNEHAALFKDDVETLVLRADLAAQKFDLQAYRDIQYDYIEGFDGDGDEFFDFAKNEFIQKFQYLPKRLDEQGAEKFERVLKDVITAYCYDGFETANRRIMRELESAGTQNAYSNIVHSLQFYTALADERYDEALHYFKQCEWDFGDDVVELYENITDGLTPPPSDDLESKSVAFLEFATKLGILTGKEIPTIVDTLEFLRSHDLPDSDRLGLIRAVGDVLPIAATDDDWIRFEQTLLAVASDDFSAFNFQSIPDFDDLSHLSKLALLFAGVFAGEKDFALKLIESLPEEDGGNGLEYLRDVYIDDAEGWGK